MSQLRHEDDILTPVISEADEPTENAAAENVLITAESIENETQAQEKTPPTEITSHITATPPPIPQKHNTPTSATRVIRKGVRQLDFSDHPKKKLKRKFESEESSDEDSPEETKRRILNLQAERFLGTWVECSHEKCKKWRFLINTKDVSELPETWYCSMNPDPKHNSCNDPAEPKVCDTEIAEFVDSPYTLGSVVWAELVGFPPWPAMVDDDPDIDQFYWLDGDSDIPAWYHVVFFDEKVQRAWIRAHYVWPMTVNHTHKSMGKIKCGVKNYENDIRAAWTTAQDALSLSTQERLTKYCFVNRFKDWKTHKRNNKNRKRLNKNTTKLVKPSKLPDEPELGTCMNIDDLESASESSMSDPENLLSEAEAFFRSQDNFQPSDSDSEFEEFDKPKKKSKGVKDNNNANNIPKDRKTAKKETKTKASIIKRTNLNLEKKNMGKANKAQKSKLLGKLPSRAGVTTDMKQTKLPTYRVKKTLNNNSKQIERQNTIVKKSLMAQTDPDCEHSEVSERDGDTKTEAPHGDDKFSTSNGITPVLGGTMNGIKKKRSKFFAPSRGAKILDKPRLEKKSPVLDQLGGGEPAIEGTAILKSTEPIVPSANPSGPFLDMSDCDLTELLEEPMSPEF